MYTKDKESSSSSINLSDTEANNLNKTFNKKYNPHYINDNIFNSVKKLLKPLEEEAKRNDIPDFNNSTNTVHNLTNITLPPNVIEILSYNLPFTPSPWVHESEYTSYLHTPNINKLEEEFNSLIKDFDEYERRCKICYIFRGHTDNKDDFNPKFHIKSNKSVDFDPSDYEAIVIKNYLSNTRRLYTQEIEKHKIALIPIYNLSESKLSECRDFMTQNKLISSPTDKNLGVAVATKEQTHNIMLEEVNNASTYRIVTLDEANRAMKAYYKRVCELVIDDEKSETPFITQQQRKYIHSITPETSKYPIIYILWKVHKTPVKTRPIVPTIGFITSRISCLLDDWLKPIVDRIPTIIKSTNHLIHYLKTHKFPKHVSLASRDVTALYPSIPLQKGLDMVSEIIVEYNSKYNLGLKTDLIIELLRLVLNNNYFTYNDVMYLQTDGAPMGSAVSVIFAVIYMYALERNIVTEYKDKGLLLYYGRFIDDIIAIFINRGENEDHFWSEFDRQEKRISLTGSSSLSDVVMLDLTIYVGDLSKYDNKGNGYLLYRMFQKELNKYLYLHADSFHQWPTLKGYVKGELIRIGRNSCNIDHYNLYSKRFYERLLPRGFTPKMLDPIFNNINYNSITLPPSVTGVDDNKTVSVDKPIIFTTRLTPLTQELDIKTILHTHFDSNVASYLGSSRAMVSYRGNTTLGQLLKRDMRQT